MIHEFAHKLAESGDAANDLPPFRDKAIAAMWDDVVEPAYKELVRDAEYGRPTLLDDYGATNRAEFFAVATESFFLKPVILRKRCPALYSFLADWYRQDPAEWKWTEAISSRARS